MDPITLAMALSQFAPQVIKWITGSDKAADAAGKVVDIAEKVTGRTGTEAVTALQADPSLVLQFRQAVMANESDLDKAYLADVQSARQRDVAVLAASGGRNTRANVMAGSAAMLVLITLGVGVWGTELNEFGKAMVSLICGRALGWVEQVFSFEFGSTRTAKVKDETINNLSK